MSTGKKIYRATQMFAVIDIIYTGVFLCRSGDINDWSFWVFSAFVCLWAYLPLAILIRYARHNRESMPRLGIALCTMISVVLWGFWILLGALVLTTGAQNAIIVVTLPGFQLAGVLVGITISEAVGRVVEMVRNRKRCHEGSAEDGKG